MSGHTTGPWVAYRTVAPRGWNIEAHDGTYTVAVARDGSSSPQNVANARLIAAAPDSHEANVKFIEAIECLCNVTAGWTDDRIYDELPSSGLAIAYFAARAAIAKATGGAA